jgi:predicted transcriptional regulator
MGFCYLIPTLLVNPSIMTCLIITIISSGVLGGTVNFFQQYSKENKGWVNYIRCIVIGLGASFLVPLFLQMISSNLVDNAKLNDKDLLVFIGFCLIASIFSRRFIETIGDKVLKQVQEAKETAQTAKEIAQTSKEEVDLMASKSTEIDDNERISSENLIQSTSTTTTTTLDPSGSASNEKAKEIIKNVLKALKDNLYTFRTLKGISKDAEITEEEALKIIQVFEKRGWVKEVSKDDKKLFALTELGNKVKVIKEE